MFKPTNYCCTMNSYFMEMLNVFLSICISSQLQHRHHRETLSWNDCLTFMEADEDLEVLSLCVLCQRHAKPACITVCCLQNGDRWTAALREQTQMVYCEVTVKLLTTTSVNTHSTFSWMHTCIKHTPTHANAQTRTNVCAHTHLWHADASSGWRPLARGGVIFQ